MSAGLAISNPPAGKATNHLYEDPVLKKYDVYYLHNQEMEYIESTDQYVKVNLAGKKGLCATK